MICLTLGVSEWRALHIASVFGAQCLGLYVILQHPLLFEEVEIVDPGLGWPQERASRKPACDSVAWRCLEICHHRSWSRRLEAAP